MASSLSRKLNSFSGKNPYDDVFGGPKKLGAPAFSSVEDYKEIFGIGSSKVSSIPVLDLSGLDEPNEYRSSKPDYSNIFAGFGDEQVGVSYQELFATSKLDKTSSHKPRTPSATGSPLPRSDNLNCSEQNQVISSKSPYQSSDAVKQFNMSYHKTNQKGKDGTKGTTHVAELRAVSGFTCFIDEMTPPQKTGNDKPKPIPVKKENDKTQISPESDVRHKMDSNDEKQTSGGAVKSRSGSSWDGTSLKDEFSNAFEMTPPRKTGNDKPKPIPIEKENDRTKPSPISDVRHKMDSNDTKQTSGRAVKSRSKSSLDGTYSKDEFLNAFEINLESPPSKANLVNSKGHLKRSTTSNFEAPKSDAGDCSSPTSDEELDVNSAAAASIAALRKAIEKAQESIRIAKESMERKKEKGGLQSCSNWSSKYSLKVKDRKENFIAPEENITKKKNARQTGERADAAYQDFTDRHESLFKELKTAKETLEQQTRVIEKSESVKEAYDLEDMDIYENAVDMAHNQEKNVDELTDYIVHKHEENEKSGIAQPDEEIREEQKGLYEHESCEEIFEDSQETIEDENEFESQDLKEIDNEKNEFESQDLKEIDNEKRLNGTLEAVENRQQEVPEKEHIEKKIKDAEENEKIPKPFHNEEVTEKRLEEEVVQWVENGSKEFCGGESNEKKQEYAHSGDITETRLDEVSWPEENEKRRAHDKKECENKIKEKYECEQNEKRYDGAYTYEGENIQSKNGESEGIEKIEVYDKSSTEADDGKDIEKKVEEECELEQNEMSYTGAYTYEGENRQRENDESEEIEKIEVDEKRSTDAHDGKETEKKIEEECDWGGNDKGVTGTDIYKEAEYFQRNGTEESETIEAPEEALYENRINRSGDACSYGASNSTSETEETSISESGDASESLPSDDNGENFGSTEMDIVDKQVEQNSEDSEFSSNLENGIEILVNESRENEKINKEYKIVFDEEEETNTPETGHEERQWAENGAELEAFQVLSVSEEKEKIIEIDEEIKTRQDTENIEKNTKETVSKEVEEKEDLRKIDEAIKREREKDRLVVERAIREARERAFAEARERAERAAVERATAEVRQRVMAEAREKHEKASAGSKSPAEKASVEAKIRAERAAVERATAEARERALEKVLSQKSTSVSEKFSGTSKDSAMNQSFSSSDSQRFDGTITESAQRCKEKSESHQRIMQRAAKALAEKNMRDLLAQKEQAERDRLAKTLDADIKRWSNGKEGNLRALLSTLQYILGPSSGWQPVSLTDIIDTNAVKKAYRKATLYVHPDKLQQRGANIQQKYICEKVFDLLKAAWNKFNSEER